MMMTVMACIAVESLDTALRWLDGFTCFGKHVETLSQRQSHTCTWFPETNQYKEWLAGENTFLWLQGKGLLLESQ